MGPPTVRKPRLWFSFEEHFDQNPIRKSWSVGNGRYQDVATTPPPQNSPLFAVLKYHEGREMWITIKSVTLRVSISNALNLKHTHAFDDSFMFDYVTILKRYNDLRAYLSEERSGSALGNTSTREFQLLIRDFLLDSEVFNGLDLREGIIPRSHQQDMQRWSTARDHDDIDAGLRYLAPYDRSMRSRLSDLIREGKLEEIRAVLRTYHQYKLDASFLGIALSFGQIEAFWLLFSKGANSDLFEFLHHEPDKPHPLALAAKYGYLTIVQVLLEHAADTDQNSLYFQCLLAQALAEAVSEGQLEIVELVLDSGAPMSGSDQLLNVPPLLTAAQKGHLDLVKLLLARGADLDQEYFAKCFHCTPCLVNHSQWGDHTALLCAAGNGHDRVVEFLLSCGARMDKHPGVLSFLWDRGSHFNPLSASVAAGHDRVVQLFINHGADIRPIHMRLFRADSEFPDLTALEMASLRGHWKVLDVLSIRIPIKPANDICCDLPGSSNPPDADVSGIVNANKITPGLIKVPRETRMQTTSLRAPSDAKLAKKDGFSDVMNHLKGVIFQSSRHFGEGLTDLIFLKWIELTAI